MLNVRFVTLTGIVLGVATMRLLPHPPNVTPIAAIALFGGAHFASKRAALAVPLTATGSVLFFVVTNFGVWLVGDLYPRTLEGLVACYVAGIPFFRNTLAGDLLYAAVLFGGLAVAERRFPVLREQSRPAVAHG